jgi:hypothetical protein
MKMLMLRRTTQVVRSLAVGPNLQIGDWGEESRYSPRLARSGMARFAT